MASDYIQAWVKLRELRNEWLNKTSEYDAVILPTSQILPPNIELLKNDGDYYKKNNLLVFSDFEKKILKTKEMNLILQKFEAINSLIIADLKSKENIYKSAKNIPNVKLTDVNHFSAFDLVKYKKLVFTESSIKELEKRYI